MGALAPDSSMTIVCAMQADHRKSVSDYRAIASDYDRRTRLTDAVRLEAVAALELRPGDVVIDVACGSGFSFAPVLRAIGTTGQLFAFDHSPDLLAIARGRIEQAGWNNVELMQSGAEQVSVSGKKPNALLFSYAHDVLQSEAALHNLLGQGAPGARVALCGSVLWPAWGWPVNWYLRATHRRYITNMENFDRPWAKIAPRLENFGVSRRGPGWRYVASGRLGLLN